jgi:hypothetical protein
LEEREEEREEKWALIIVLKTNPIRWFNQKKPEPKPSPVF